MIVGAHYGEGQEVPLSLHESDVPRRASLGAVLEHAWAAEPVTAADVMAATGLTRSTAIEAVDALVALGLLRELPNARAGGEYTKGRPARRFALDARAAVVIGVDAGHLSLVVTVADLAGTTVARLSVPADADDSPAGRRRALGAAIDAALARARRPRTDVLALCVGVPAPVDAQGRSPAHRDTFWDRMNPDLVDHLGWVPIVRVENDANLAVLAERAVGAGVGSENVVAMLAGVRLGAGVVLGGRLLRGAHGGAGELVALAHVDGVGAVDGLGQRIAAWAAAAEVPAGHPLGEPGVSARTVLDLARDGEPHALAVAHRAGVLVARVAGLLGSLYDPDRIVVSGAVAAGIEPVLAVARRLLPDELDLPAPELLASPLGADVVAIGAVAGALEAARAGVLALR